jgi:ssDNA-binding Zn-finger/Zn-ribbon topoisomerase 1
VSRPRPKCPSCGSGRQQFKWRGVGSYPVHLECPTCDWVWRALPIELADGPAPWNTHGDPQARLAASWAAIRAKEAA